MNHDPREGRLHSIKAPQNTPPTSLTQELETHWVSAVSALGIEPQQAHPAFDTIIERYSEDSRAYHNLTHIQKMLEYVDTESGKLENAPQVVLAVFFHDAIYDSHATDNEEKSAELVSKLLEPLGINQSDADTISQLVISTKLHQPILPGPDNQIFLDADLAILGASPEAYLKYTDAIREEYSWVPEEHYAERRKEVMENFLKRKEIYFSESAREAFEGQARENIHCEIRSLT